MPDTSAIAALVLAAGFSSRMDTGYKVLLPLGPEGHALDLLALFYAAIPVTAVSGRREGRAVAAEAARLGWAHVNNPAAGRGMFSSVRVGLEAMALSGAEHFFLHPADIPLVRPSTLHFLLREAQESPNAVLIPTFRGEEGHPPLIPAKHIPAILAWPGENGLRGALAALPCRQVPVPDKNILMDMDTDADYERARRLAARRHLLEPEEAETLLFCRPLPANILAHVRAVSRVAAAFAQAAGLDPQLAASGALLHDMCRLEQRHGQAAARELRTLGLPRLAELVAEHMDCTLPDNAPVSEKELIYLADKYVHEDVAVPLRERYARQKEKTGGEAHAVINARLARAEHLEQRLAREWGRPPFELALRALS